MSATKIKKDNPAPESKPSVEVKPFRNLGELKLQEHSYHSFGAIVESHNTAETLSDPIFWQHAAAKLTSGSQIRCIAQDGSFMAFVYIAMVFGTDVKAVCYEFYKLDNVVKTDGLYDNYDIKPAGAGHGWYVADKRTGDRLFVGTSFARQSDAMKHLEEYIILMSK